MKKFLKENLVPMIFMVLFIFVVNYELPYYISAPGGTINLSKRMDQEYSKKDGSLNMLYVTEYRGNVVTLLLGQIFKNWDIYEISNQQISNENSQDIYLRNRIMLDNSIQNAIFVAYQQAGKEVKIKGRENLVIATTKENIFEIGDNVIAIGGTKFEEIKDIKKMLESYKVGDSIKVDIVRNGKEKELNIILEEDKVLGLMVITNYIYDVSDEIDFNFKSGEGGASGGLILTLGIYSEISGVDLLKGRNVAGTGTIDMNGNVGEIDGIKYKIAGAVKNKMDVVLVPTGNYEEAKKVVQENKYDIELVEVKTFKDAVDYLVG